MHRSQAPLGLLIALLGSLTGCAYSMVQGDAVRPDPFADVVARTIEARGLPLPQHYETRVIDREEIPELLRRVLLDDWEPGEMHDYQEALTAMGAWPPDRDLVDEYVAVSRDELAGVYVPQDVTLYVVGDTPAPLSVKVLSAMMHRDLALEMVLAHELVHLLQHAAYPHLMEDDANWRDQDDAMAAVHAAIEGDATRYGLEAVIGGPGGLPEPETFQAQMQEQDARTDGALGRAPALVRLTLTFPYAGGYALSFHEGPALLEAPPASTEQVLHPERRHEPFLAIDLGALAQRLPDGCRPLAENTMGELGISVLLRDLADAPAPDGWSGWDGDRYLAAECDGRRAFVWDTRWDTPQDADEFAAAYREIAPAVAERAALAAPPVVRVSGERVRIASRDLADLTDALDRYARTGRVATVSDLRAYFDVPYAER